MDVVEELDDPFVPIATACEALGLSRATLYRNTRPSLPRRVVVRAPSPRRLSDEERDMIRDVFHSPEFVDQPVPEVYATLLSRGVYLASMRTMYRVLAETGETRERRNQRHPQAHATPSLTATAPNQVWTWDITKLATAHVGVFLHLYVIIDLFSRYVVGWLVATKECKHLAAQLFADSIARYGIEPGLMVHSDRGSAMKSDTLAQLLASLGVQRSFSRPRVSDDNPFSEAHFKTLKYQPDYPGRFDGELHARGWLAPFFGWHNDEHHHSGLAFFTPADVFFERVEEVRAIRQTALNAVALQAARHEAHHFACHEARRKKPGTTLTRNSGTGPSADRAPRRGLQCAGSTCGVARSELRWRGGWAVFEPSVMPNKHGFRVRSPDVSGFAAEITCDRSARRIMSDHPSGERGIADRAHRSASRSLCRRDPKCPPHASKQ